jgi:hypothetical protein
MDEPIPSRVSDLDRRANAELARVREQSIRFHQSKGAFDSPRSSRNTSDGTGAFDTFGTTQNKPSTEIRPLPDPLPKVPKLDPLLVPKALRDWVVGTAAGLQVPLEFAAVPAIVAAAGVIGRQIGISMKQNECWIERAILWGALVGRPSTLKSPALRPAQRILAQLETNLRSGWESQTTEANLLREICEQERRLKKKEADNFLRAGKRESAIALLREAQEGNDDLPEPRLVVNDATVEKLGELLNANPRGLIQFRDELAGWLASLDREGRDGDRGFWLECWNGQGPYTCDRIGRGTVRIDAPAVSILGGIQPGKLAEYVRSAVKGGMGDDGLLQRFQMAVYPDVPASWRYTDQRPSAIAEASARAVYERLIQLDPISAGAEVDASVDVPYLRFSPQAQELFVEWYTKLMLRTRSGSEAGHMESHLAKYPALAGRLALVLHLCDHDRGPIQVEALAAALDWCEFLEPHARRIYSPAVDNGLSAAHELLRRRSELPDQFKAREIYRRNWTGIDRDTLDGALEILVHHGHLIEFPLETGGRPSTLYVWRQQ